MGFFSLSTKYGDSEKLTKNETIACWAIPIVIGLLFAIISENFAFVVFGVIGGGLLTLFCRGRKHGKAERAFFDDLQARGIKPKITKVTLTNNGVVTVNVEDYGEFWTLLGGKLDLSWSEHSDIKFDGTKFTDQSFKTTDVSWTDDTVTVTYTSTENVYPYREMTFEKTYDVFKETISWRRVD